MNIFQLQVPKISVIQVKYPDRAQWLVLKSRFPKKNHLPPSDKTLAQVIFVKDRRLDEVNRPSGERDTFWQP